MLVHRRTHIPLLLSTSSTVQPKAMLEMHPMCPCRGKVGCHATMLFARCMVQYVHAMVYIQHCYKQIVSIPSQTSHQHQTCGRNLTCQPVRTGSTGLSTPFKLHNTPPLHWSTHIMQSCYDAHCIAGERAGRSHDLRTSTVQRLLHQVHVATSTCTAWPPVGVSRMCMHPGQQLPRHPLVNHPYSAQQNRLPTYKMQVQPATQMPLLLDTVAPCTSPSCHVSRWWQLPHSMSTSNQQTTNGPKPDAQSNDMQALDNTSHNNCRTSDTPKAISRKHSATRSSDTSPTEAQATHPRPSRTCNQVHNFL